MLFELNSVNDIFTVSPISLVKGCNTLSAKTRACGTEDCFLVSNVVVYSHRERWSLWWVPFSHQSLASFCFYAVVLGRLHNLLTHPNSGLLFSCGPHGGIVGFEYVTSRLGAEEAPVKEAAVAYVSTFVCSVDVSSLPVAQGGFYCAHGVLHGHRLYRDIVVLLISSVAILKFGIFSETAN